MDRRLEQEADDQANRGSANPRDAATNTMAVSAGGASPFAVTIFIGALLLFQVQLILGKAVLPWFGGTPAVWSTCLLFYQVLLLVGYAYAHGAIAWLSPARQSAVHIGALALSLVSFVVCCAAWGAPLLPDASWKPPDASWPITRIVVILGAASGIPYLVLAATSPLMQAWFARVHPGSSPVRLYALSNAGSLLGLLTYPFAVEPMLGLRTQGFVWGLLFVIFCVGSVVCALQARRADAATVHDADEGEAPTFVTRLYWIALAACGSMLLMSTTNHICQELSTSPILWTLPLATYLLTLILCFDRERTYVPGLFSILFGASMALTVWLLLEAQVRNIWLVVGGSLFALFVGCMICHGELVRSRPGARHLTLFYLMISLGGALGGSLVTVSAPLLFHGYVETQISQMLCAALLLVALLRDRESWLYGGRPWTAALTLAFVLLTAYVGAPRLVRAGEGGAAVATYALAVVLVTALGVCVAFIVGQRLKLGLRKQGRPLTVSVAVCAVVAFAAALSTTARPFEWTKVSHVRRNFYGVVRVIDDGPQRILVHGSTFHGWQIDDNSREPLGYYARGTGVGLVLEEMQALHPTIRVGIVGLGAGALAAYGRPGDEFVYYEIDPEVIDVAAGKKPWFTYISRSQATVQVVEGDARLSLERDGGRFQLLILDAFSSDAIPVHLLTREAFRMYVDHLAPDGVIAIHLSNRYLDLVPVVRRLCDDAGLHTIFIDRPGVDVLKVQSLWAVAARKREFLARPRVGGAATADTGRPAAQYTWTDDWSNVMQTLRR